MDLILWRHADAENGVHDSERKLTAKGIKQATRMAKWLRARIPDVANRIVFLPFLAHDAFLGILKNADAVLDTPHFSGGTTSFETFAAGVPIVTWPGRYARSRPTAALYRQMGVTGLTADHAAQYVDLALRLARDPDWRAQKQAELRQKCAVLYENLEAVRELERFFAAAVAAAADGRKLQSWPQ